MPQADSVAGTCSADGSSRCARGFKPWVHADHCNTEAGKAAASVCECVREHERPELRQPYPCDKNRGHIFSGGSKNARTTT